MKKNFRVLSALSGLLTLTFPRHSFQKERKKNNEQFLKNAVRNQLTPVKFLQRNNTTKIEKKLPLLYNQKILTKSNLLPGNGAKMLGAGITVKQLLNT